MRRLKQLWLLGVILALFQPVYSQSSKAFSGREFWITYTQNLYQPNDLLVYVIPETIDTVTVFNPQTNFSIAPVPVKPGIWNPVIIPLNRRGFEIKKRHTGVCGQCFDGKQGGNLRFAG
jgi:hypothetical protein